MSGNRNELLEKILLAVEGGGGSLSIKKELTQPYYLDNPATGVHIDTGIDISTYPSDTSITVAVKFSVPSTQTEYALFGTADAILIMANEDVIIPRTSEFEGTAGDSDFGFWYSGTTGTIHYYCDVDGPDKVAIAASVNVVQSTIESA